MSKRRRTPAQGERRRVADLVERNTKDARTNGSRLRHGTTASWDAGCRCLRDCIAQAKRTDQPCHPDWPVAGTLPSEPPAAQPPTRPG